MDHRTSQIASCFFYICRQRGQLWRQGYATHEFFKHSLGIGKAIDSVVGNNTGVQMLGLPELFSMLVEQCDCCFNLTLLQS